MNKESPVVLEVTEFTLFDLINGLHKECLMTGDGYPREAHIIQITKIQHDKWEIKGTVLYVDGWYHFTAEINGDILRESCHGQMTVDLTKPG